MMFYLVNGANGALAGYKLVVVPNPKEMLALPDVLISYPCESVFIRG